MKKMLIILCLLFLTACTHTNTSYNIYYDLKDKLVSQSEFSDDYPFDAYVVFNELDDYYRYDVIVDNAQVNMYDITAMAYCNEDDNTSCPVIGLFDEDSYHLIPDFVDKDNNYYKGIQLSGQCDKKQDVKLYISYYLDEDETEFQEYFLEVEGL